MTLSQLTDLSGDYERPETDCTISINNESRFEQIAGEVFRNLVFLFLSVIPMTCILISHSIIHGALFGEGVFSLICKTIGIVYLLWFVYDMNTPLQGQHRGWCAQSTLYRFCCDQIKRQFDHTLVASPDTEKILRSEYKSKIYCCHPHGLLSYGTIISFGSSEPVFGRWVTTVTLNIQFFLPIWRDLIIGAGFCASEKRAIRSVLRDGRDLAVVVGGARETGKMAPNIIEVFIKNRRGIFELALQEGSSLVPVIHFGENELYAQFKRPWLERIQIKILKLTSLFPIVFYGRYGIFPFKVKLTTVFGDPIHVGRSRERPSEEEIANLRDAYIEKLKTLHEKYKHLRPGKPSTLIIN